MQKLHSQQGDEKYKCSVYLPLIAYFTFLPCRSERELIEKIVNSVWRKVLHSYHQILQGSWSELIMHSRN